MKVEVLIRGFRYLTEDPNGRAPFLRQYKRKAHPENDPNDRGYDCEIQQYLTQLAG
jgi:hypothetical protein